MNSYKKPSKKLFEELSEGYFWAKNDGHETPIYRIINIINIKKACRWGQNEQWVAPGLYILDSDGLTSPKLYMQLWENVSIERVAPPSFMLADK